MEFTRLAPRALFGASWVQLKTEISHIIQLMFNRGQRGECRYLLTDNRRATIGNTTFLQKTGTLKILLLLQWLQHSLQISHKHSKLNYKGSLDAGFLNFPPKIFRTTKSRECLRKNRRRCWKTVGGRALAKPNEPKKILGTPAMWQI